MKYLLGLKEQTIFKEVKDEVTDKVKRNNCNKSTFNFAVI